MKNEPRDTDAPDRPETAAAGDEPTAPSVGSAAERSLGAPPGAISTGDTSSAERRQRGQDAAVAEGEHDAFWRETFATRDYADADHGYDHYRPAYRYGWQSAAQRGPRPFDEVEPELREGWDADTTGLQWSDARPAIRDAYGRASNTDESTPGNPLA